VGSMSSHLASVAREFGVPTVVDAGNATSRLSNDELVTLHADRTSLYRGVVEELTAEMRPARKLIFGSPVHRRMRDILDRISPLNLTDPASPAFVAEACRTFHDIIRYTHERAMQVMFGMAGETGATQSSVRLVSTLPLNLAVVDLGGGLRAGLTVCDRVTPDHIESMPLKAIWRGFAHPGVDWAGTMSIDRTTFSGSLAISATSEFGEVPGGDSYAVVSREYVNLSIRFAYHFATIDALCGENISQNYARLQFAGGAGAYYGRSLRVQLIGAVLEKMGFQVTLKGDLLEASISRYDRESLEEKLDLLGRLLASSRLLDMNITDQEQIERAVAAFFRGEYDLLMQREDSGMPGFYLQGGSWQRVSEEGEQLILQVGSRWGRRVASEMTGLIGKMFGTSYHDFLDTIEAYSYFPLAILKDVELANGRVRVRIKPVGGKVDRAGGIVFGMRNIDNYFVLRTNALEGNIILFEYVNGRRLERQAVRKRIESDRWHQLSVEIKGESVKGYFNDELVVEYQAGIALKGFVGLWTKADSVIFFDGPIIEDRGSNE
jgi:pyruvate,water dikinase